MSKYKAWADKIQMFRFHDSFHLGLGDIRLSRGDGDDLMRDLMEADALEARVAELEAENEALHKRWDAANETFIKMEAELARLRQEAMHD